MDKIRTIITQDAEVDDQNSLRHFLLYANEVELLGIVQTSSKFHWKGIPGARKPEKAPQSKDFAFEENGAWDTEYRWTGTDWMQRVADAYEKDYPNLCRHADGYPTPEYIRSIIKTGNIGYEGETEHPTEGSELIRKHILDDDPRPLYLQVWGGCNTIARALMDIQKEYEGKTEWRSLHESISRKVIMLACGEQDPCYRSYIAEEWPDIQFVKMLQMQSYAYPWFLMPEGESKDTLRAAFMKNEILDVCHLTTGYCTWLDGTEYEGEAMDAQFGSNPNIASEWFGARMGMGTPEKYDFLSEGDSPTYLALFNWGFRTLEDFSYGGIAGRYHKVEGETNSKGQPLNMWDVSKDYYLLKPGLPLPRIAPPPYGPDPATVFSPDHKYMRVESMWPYVADIQRDFAARAHWAACDRYEDCEHAPDITIQEGLNFTVEAGETLTLHHAVTARDGNPVTVRYRVYKDASAPCGEVMEIHVRGNTAEIEVPVVAQPGKQAHVIVCARSMGHYRLAHYQHIIITIA